MTKCSEETIGLGRNVESIKGLKCLGTCKGEQTCSSRCFDKYGNPGLDGFLNCVLEREKCMPMPPSVTSGDISDSSTFAVSPGFRNGMLEGRWFKVAGISDIYDMFDCQTNMLTIGDAKGVLGIEFRTRGEEGGYYSSSLKESVDFTDEGKLRTEGSMYGLTFNERWTVVGGNSEVKGDVGRFWIIRYVGRTLQGEYEGGFVYGDSPRMNEATRREVGKVWKETQGTEYEGKFKDIDNACDAVVGGKGELRKVSGG